MCIKSGLNVYSNAVAVTSDRAPLKADLRDPQLTIKWYTLSSHASALFKINFFVNNSLTHTQRLRPELKIDAVLIKDRLGGSGAAGTWILRRTEMS